MHRSRQALVEDDDEVSSKNPPDTFHQNLGFMSNPSSDVPLYSSMLRAQLAIPSEEEADGLHAGRTRRWGSTSQIFVGNQSRHSDHGPDSQTLATDRDYFMPSLTAGVAPEKASAILSQFERKRKAAALAVPTGDGHVRQRLREMGEPMTFFGEDASDRRDRLRQLMLAEVDEEESVDIEMQDADDQEQGEVEEEFYTEGVSELLQARKHIATYSLPRAKARVASQKLESNTALRIHSKHRKAIKDRLQLFELAGSQIAGDRPVSITRFAPNGESLAAGNWGGGIRILDVPDLNQKRSLRGHTGRIGGLSWMPGATLPGSSVSESSANLASGGEEGTVHLWSLTQDTPISALQGHSGRVCRVEFHPSGRYLASASYDTSWRLWDVETGTELLIQEGHSREVYAVAFSTDGSLLASAGLDSIGRIWDLRSGRTLMILDGHIREIYALDWGIDGHRVLSGSGDGFVKCWDLRMVREVSRVGAHKSVVSDLRWFKGMDSYASAPSLNGGSSEEGVEGAKPRKSGTFFVSSGYDKNVNVFSADDWALCKTLSGHAGNVTSVDVTADSRWIASSGQDRTVKLWGADDGAGI